MRASDTVVRRMVGPKGPRRHRRAALATVLIRPTRAAARRAACERAHGCPVRSHTTPAPPPMPENTDRGDDARASRPAPRPSGDDAMPDALPSLDDARARQDALAVLHAAAIDACRNAADACAQRMLR